MQRLARTGQRFGYGLFGAAVVLFFVGFPTGFPDWLISAIVACLAVGSIVLAPAIVVGYGVKAADREDRESGHTTYVPLDHVPPSPSPSPRIALPYIIFSSTFPR